MTEELTSNSGGPENQSTYNLESVIEDFKKVLTGPAGFYRAMPTDGGYVNPLIFIAVMAVASGVLAAILSIVGLGAGASMMGGTGFMMIIMLPIGAAIGSFIVAALLFVVWKLMGSTKNYETAYRCIAFATAIMPITMLLSIIPYLGTIAKNLWGAYLLFIASTEVHAIKQQTAKIVFAVLAVITVIVGVKSEYEMRKFQSYYEQAVKDVKGNPNVGSILKDMENMENMTPEEAGKAMGEFMKSVEEFGKGVEASTKAEENQKDD